MFGNATMNFGNTVSKEAHGMILVRLCVCWLQCVWHCVRVCVREWVRKVLCVKVFMYD